MPSRILVDTWREQGAGACVRKLRAATGMALPMLLTGKRTAAGVAAYFDLITGEGRRFYGDSFHFGYFRTGAETLPQALDAHTDLVAEMAEPTGEQHILDVGGFAESPPQPGAHLRLERQDVLPEPSDQLFALIHETPFPAVDTMTKGTPISVNLHPSLWNWPSGGRRPRGEAQHQIAADA